MLVYADPEVVEAVACSSCFAKVGVWCGYDLAGPMVHENRVKAYDAYLAAERVARFADENFEWPTPDPVPELLYIADPHDPKGKWFPVHERSEGMYSESVGRHVYIPAGTKVMDRARDHLHRWMTGYRASPWGIMAWARNKTEIRDLLVARGYKVMFNGKIQEEEMTRLGDSAESSYDQLLANAQASLERARDNAQRQIEAAASVAAAQVDAAQRRLDRLTQMPREPQIGEDGRQPVIRFQRVFAPGGRAYDYAAARASNGRWNTTGPKAPKDYSWAELITWIMDGSDVVDVEVATSFGDL